MTVSPENPGASSATGAVVARLIGDFAQYQQIEDFDNQILFVPASPNNNERVSKRKINSMLIPDSQITWDGLECDKIGVAYHAFRFQASRCERHRGDCLRNQVEDFHQGGEHFVGSFGNLQNLGPDSTTNRLYLSYINEITSASLLTLTISTDDAKFVINRAPGHIEDCFIEDFESFKEHGILNCTIINDGKVDAQFRVSILNCTNGINPILGKTQTIEASSTAYFGFDVYSENPDNSQHQCKAELYDSLEVLIHYKIITFQSTKLKEDKGALDGNGPNEGFSFIGSKSQQQCTDMCSSLYVVSCNFAFPVHRFD